MPYSGGLARNIAQCLDDFGIPLYLSQTVVRIHGKERVEGVTVANVDENRRPVPGTEEFIECDTLLLSVGLIPENEIANGAEVKLDRVTGGALVDQYNETSVKGIYACGNALHVHDLVDFVTKEAYVAGESAAKRILHGADTANKLINVKASGYVRYTVPQTVRIDNDTNELKFLFRVSDTLKKPVFEVICDGEVIKTVKKQIAAPGEMESIILKDEEVRKLMNSTSVEIVGKGEKR
jgi:pyruvate/2-oxoglutarate dehydrogenase complex dihydrolipoamide dehydrogenase (E3) component